MVETSQCKRIHGDTNKKARPKPCLKVHGKRLLLFLLAFVGRRRFFLRLSLRFRLFHRLLGFGGFFGASLGALFLLLIENLLAAKKFQESLVGAVALVPHGADDARVSAVTITEA